MNTAIVAIPNRIAKWSLTWALLLIVFSLLALTIPLIASFSALVIIGWLLVFSGVTQGLHAFHSKGVGDVLWKLFVAILYFVLGIYLDRILKRGAFAPKLAELAAADSAPV